MKKIGIIAEAHRIEPAPHNPQSRVSTMASLHVDFSTPSFAVQEISGPSKDPYWEDLFEGKGPRYDSGFALPPDKPGLGLGFDEDVAKKRPYTPFNRHQLRFLDGGIADP